jgi:hypothetical protein
MKPVETLQALLRIRRLQVQVLSDAPFPIKDFRNTKTPKRRSSPDKILTNEGEIGTRLDQAEPRRARTSEPLPIRRERADAAVRAVRGNEQRVEHEQRRDADLQMFVDCRILVERRAWSRRASSTR